MCLHVGANLVYVRLWEWNEEEQPGDEEYVPGSVVVGDELVQFHLILGGLVLLVQEHGHPIGNPECPHVYMV